MWIPCETIKGLGSEDVEFRLNVLKRHVIHKNRDFHYLFIDMSLMLREKLGTRWVDIDYLGE